MMNLAKPMTFRRLLADAVAYFATHGYVSRVEIENWLHLLRGAAERELGPEAKVDAETKASMDAIYRRIVDRHGLVKYVPGVSRYTVAMLQPQLRAELDRRILAAADLIKIHRREAIEKTLQRFSGWATSIPAGGSGVIDKREVSAHVCKSLTQQRFERRRVAIDQGHKLIANVSEIVARGSGAIAGEWHDRGEHDKNYNARKEHLARSGKIYAIKDSWAAQEGLINKGAGYYEDMTAVGSEPFCSCWMRWISSPRQLPEKMLTKKGREWVERSGGGVTKSAGVIYNIDPAENLG